MAKPEIETWLKDPQAVLDWTWNWSDWLQEGEEVASTSSTISPGLIIDEMTNTSTTITVWISGGTVGNPYRVTVQVVTNQGRTDERSALIRVTNR